jgi:hypothetical protein
MTLYLEVDPKIADTLAQRGFFRLGVDALLCSDRSLADAPPPPGVEAASEVAEVRFDFDEVDQFEVFPTDLPPARYFHIPLHNLKGIKPTRHLMRGR